MRLRLIILISVLSTLFIFTYYRLHLLLNNDGAAFSLTSLVLLLIVGWQVLHRIRPEVFDARWFLVLAWTASVTMGLWATFIMISLPVSLLEFFLGFFVDFGGMAGTSLAATSAGIITALGFLTVVRGPHVKKIDINFADNSGRMPQSLKIAQLSDLHVGSTIRRSYVEEVVRRTNETEPDLIVLTGDFADGEADLVFPALQALQDLRSRFGVFYVTGNHEYYWGAEKLITKLESLGIKALINTHLPVTLGDARVMIAGVTDPAGKHFVRDHQPDLQKAVRTDTAFDFKILLAHRPGVCVEAEKLDIDLQLSGHTHAGQFFPFSLLIPLAHRYYRGLNHHGKLQLYINPGTGYWGPPNRFTVASEITLLNCHFSSGSLAAGLQESQ